MQHANIYSEFNKRTHKHNKIAKVLRDHEHLLQWGPEERILDAGCGPGDITACVISPWLPQDFQLLLGADVSSSVIDHALELNASEKVTFQVLDVAGDISDFLKNREFSQGFDKIFSFYVLQWLPDLSKGLQNLFRLLRTRGQMLVMFPADRLFQKTFMEIRNKEPWSKYSREAPRKLPPFLTKGSDQSEEFREMLLDAGFEVLKCETQKFTSHFDSVDDIKDLIESLDHDMDGIPEKLRPQFLQDCYQVLLNMNAVHVSDSGLVLTQSMLLAVARKPA